MGRALHLEASRCMSFTTGEKPDLQVELLGSESQARNRTPTRLLLLEAPLLTLLDLLPPAHRATSMHQSDHCL